MSFRGLGPGRVITHQSRAFQGADTVFATIEFPHVDMRAQVPVDSYERNPRLRPVIARTRARALLRSLGEEGSYMARTWDRREEIAEQAINHGGAEEWARLLRDFAATERQGVSMAISDVNMIDKTVKMLAAEIACATDTEFRVRWREVQQAYNVAASRDGGAER